MSNGRMELLHGVAELGTHHAFVNLVARLSWALKDVASYSLDVAGIDAGVRLGLIAWVPAAEHAGLRAAVTEAGFKVTDFGQHPAPVMIAGQVTV